ncbi:MAG: AAA family ATPase [Oscillatoriales cyanobacterium SM2_2_1]|nr:AAA family ATPase [Oscillatoriales cyanobacterium SM2_2_1]
MAIAEEFYLSPRFLDRVSLHLTKNFLHLPHLRTPLILGIHGPKGEGKSFQCELVFRRLGIEPVYLSAGELESPDAGDPARLLRLRYREAAELIRVRGKMCALVIHDLDAGAGRVDAGTQYTVNTQLVNATLMNIADHPTNVQLPGSYDLTPIRRVPIIATGNDFSTLYAPLVRDGRMDKFYWLPDRQDRLEIVLQIFAPEGVPRHEVERLVDAFAGQSVDFFAAVRSRLYDQQVLTFIHQVGYERLSLRLANSAEPPPEFRLPRPSLAQLQELGTQLVAEAEIVARRGLVDQYLTKHR